MKESIVIINKEILTYEGLIYNYQSFFENIRLKRKRYIIVLNEDIYVEKVNVTSDKILVEDIEKIKEKSFGNDEEYLIDYKLNRKEKNLYIYAIKGGVKVSKLCYGASKVKVVPLQIFVMKKLSKKIKDKKYNCIFRYKEIYYYYSVSDGFIEESYISKDSAILLKKISSSEKEYVIYVEKNIDNLYLKDRKKVKELELEGVFNEKIFA